MRRAPETLLHFFIILSLLNIIWGVVLADEANILDAFFLGKALAEVATRKPPTAILQFF